MSETPTAPAAAPAPEGAPKIQETTLRDLDPRLQKQVEAADKAVDKNPPYAVEICNNILTTYPGCLDVRKILRKAQRKANASKSKGMTRFLSFTKTPFMLKAGAQMKSNPRAALDEAEKQLNENPGNIQALKLLGQAASNLGMIKTAVFAYDTAREVQPENVEILLLLGGALIDAGQPKEAVRWGDQILELHPGHGDAQAMLRKASVAITMDKGKWDEQSDFRQKLANAEQATALEQAARHTNDADTIELLINQLKEKIEKEPENVNHYRDIIGHYKQLHRFADALEWVRKARQQPLGKADTTLEKLESDMTVADMRTKMESLQADLAQNPTPEKIAEMDGLKKRELEFRLAQAKILVDKYPNDYGFRFEYGSLLLDTGQVDLSIRELQLARRSPKVAHKAMLNLGRAYNAKGIKDLAIEQFVAAKTELTLWSDLKKEVIYELAQTYRTQGQMEKAIDEFKLIYGSDIDYRDVSKIINDYYEQRNKT